MLTDCFDSCGFEKLCMHEFQSSIADISHLLPSTVSFVCSANFFTEFIKLCVSIQIDYVNVFACTAFLVQSSVDNHEMLCIFILFWGLVSAVNHVVSFLFKTCSSFLVTKDYQFGDSTLFTTDIATTNWFISISCNLLCILYCIKFTTIQNPIHKTYHHKWYIRWKYTHWIPIYINTTINKIKMP